MTAALTTCFAAAALLTLATAVLLLLPVTRRELRLWHRLRTGALRRRLTGRARVPEPLDPLETPRRARRNLLWHLVMTGLFAGQLAVSISAHGRWWRPLALPLVVPCLAYFAGSLVQRQKIAVLAIASTRRVRRR